MKKDKPFRELFYCSLIKTLLIMRISAFLLILGILQTYAVDTYSQKTRLTLDFSNTELIKVLDNIEVESEFFFLYNEKLLDTDRKVNITADNQLIDVILDDLFAGTNVKYTIIDRKIILAPEYLTGTIEQQLTIKGIITDEKGNPVAGATVQIEGTTIGVLSDGSGKYSLSNVPANATLIFSFVGLKTQRVSIGTNTTIDIIMSEDAIMLNEVVAIGYGTMKKSDLTGSIMNVKIKEELSQLPNISIVQSLQGSVAGLNVGATNMAGEEPSLSVRGYNSLSTSKSDIAPLIVLDGVIYRGNLIDLNTNDIESIDILKDASSAAIYGSQASNGVMLITTRKGVRSEKPIFNYSTQFSLQVPYNEMVPMQREELEQFIMDANWWRGSRLAPDYLQVNPEFSFVQYLKSTEIKEGYQQGLDNDWWGMFTGNGHIINHNLSVSGKNQGFGYFVSGGFSDVKGYVKNDTYKKYNFRINLDYEINEWLSVGLESFLASSDYSGVSPAISSTFTTQAWSPIYDVTGDYLLTPNGQSLNPFLQIQADDEDKQFNVVGNMHADIKLPLIKGLSYRINYSQNYKNDIHNYFNPWGANYTGSGYKDFDRYGLWSLDNIVTYARRFNDIHNINLTLVYGVEELNTSTTGSSAQKFTNDDLGYNRLQAGDPTLFSITTGAQKESSLYSSARLFYGFRDKYLFTGTIRRDGFSGFGSNKKIGIFPSFALAWVVSEEDFFKSNLEWFNYLKLRGSYGSSGRRGVNRYDTKAVVSSAPAIIFGDGGSATIGQWISKMANNDLGWETTTGFNIGADFSFISSKLYGNVEYYINNTRDILYNIQLPTMTGFSSIPFNIGKVHNNGIEFTLNGKILNTQKLSWVASVNYSRNRNRIVSILGSENDQNDDGKEDDLVANSLFIGEPQGVIYDYEITGELWQLADLDAGIIPSGFTPGTLKVVDQNDDGIFSANDDRKILGYTDPSYRFGITNTFQYKNFNLYVFINSIQGGRDYYRAKVDPAWTFDNIEFITQGTGPKGAFDYWMPENPNSKYRRLDWNPSYEGFHYDQRNFIRLQDITLSYSFRNNLIRKLSINNLKIYASGKNLLTLTKWEGLDPELGIGISPAVPLMSSYTLGLNLEF